MADYLDGGVLWIAREPSDVVAFCFLEREPDLTWLESLAVEPGHEARGIGICAGLDGPGCGSRG